MLKNVGKIAQGPVPQTACHSATVAAVKQLKVMNPTRLGIHQQCSAAEMHAANYNFTQGVASYKHVKHQQWSLLEHTTIRWHLKSPQGEKALISCVICGIRNRKHGYCSAHFSIILTIRFTITARINASAVCSGGMEIPSPLSIPLLTPGQQASQPASQPASHAHPATHAQPRTRPPGSSAPAGASPLPSRGCAGRRPAGGPAGGARRRT